MPDPPNWQYYPSDLHEASRVFLVHHHSSTSGVSTLFDIRGGDPKLRIVAFPLASQDWLAPAPLFAEVTLSSQAPWPGPFGVFRNNTLYIDVLERVRGQILTGWLPKCPFSARLSFRLAAH